MRERIRADDRFIRWNRHSQHVGDHAAGAKELARFDSGGHSVIVGARSDAHDDFFQRGVAGSFADSIDRPFHLARTIANARQGVGRRKTQIVVAVDADGRPCNVRNVLPNAANQFTVLFGNGVARGVGKLTTVAPASITASNISNLGKEILKCFWMHCNTAYDAMIRMGGNQGITAGYGQLISLSGLGPGGTDMTNDLTLAILEVVDEMSPILEPKPNVRLHRGSPDALLDRLVDMIAGSQGAPFLLNFDERSMAGLLLEADKERVPHLISEGNVFDYASVGCLENTMAGNDRSGTVDANLNLLKAVELALTGGYDLLPFTDPMTGKTERLRCTGPRTPHPSRIRTFNQFWDAYAEQTRHIEPAHRGALREKRVCEGPLPAHPVPLLPRARVCGERAGRDAGRSPARLRDH